MNDLMSKARFASIFGWVQITFGSTLFMRDYIVWAWLVTIIGIINVIAAAIMGYVYESRTRR